MPLGGFNGLMWRQQQLQQLIRYSMSRYPVLASNLIIPLQQHERLLLLGTRQSDSLDGLSISVSSFPSPVFSSHWLRARSGYCVTIFFHMLCRCSAHFYGRPFVFFTITHIQWDHPVRPRHVSPFFSLFITTYLAFFTLLLSFVCFSVAAFNFFSLISSFEPTWHPLYTGTLNCRTVSIVFVPFTHWIHLVLFCVLALLPSYVRVFLR